MKMGSSYSKMQQKNIFDMIQKYRNKQNFNLVKFLRAINNDHHMIIVIYSFALLEKIGYDCFEIKTINTLLHYVSASISDKILNDEPFRQKQWAEVANISLPLFNAYENKFLKQIDYKCLISPTEYKIIHQKIKILLEKKTF